MRKLCVLVISFALCGCGTYSESGLASALDDKFIGELGVSRSGVSDTPLAADAYRIRGFGNQNASFEKTNAVAMARAAELASENGYELFKILDFATWEKSTLHSTPAIARTSTDVNLHAMGPYITGTATSRTTFTPGRNYTLDRPRTDIVVQFVRADSVDAPSALRVAEIITRYGKKAGLSPEQMQAAMNISPASFAEPDLDHKLIQAPPVAASVPMRAAAAQPQQVRQAGPTLDQVYKALTPGQKAQVDSLPPAKRADFLMMIRDGAH